MQMHFDGFLWNHLEPELQIFTCPQVTPFGKAHAAVPDCENTSGVDRLPGGRLGTFNRHSRDGV